MNKMEILKNTFESIGYKTCLCLNEDIDIYFLKILGTCDSDAYPYEFTLNLLGEPVEYENDEFRTLQEHNKYLETLYERKEE